MSEVVTSRFSERELEEHPRLRSLVRARHEAADAEYPLPHARTSPDQFVANAIAADPALAKLVAERAAARTERMKRLARVMGPAHKRQGWPWVTPTASDGHTKAEHAAEVNKAARDAQTALREAKEERAERAERAGK